ncbi:MAG: hypothetical protein M5U26_26005 [Planctomycetota bacterium]|nr:hypothetical protein [Planctomycetota bacterium]
MCSRSAVLRATVILLCSFYALGGEPENAAIQTFTFEHQGSTIKATAYRGQDGHWVPHGTWISTLEGKRNGYREYAHGKLNGRVETYYMDYKGPQLSTVATYKMGVRDGEFREAASEYTPEVVGHYAHGLKDGTWRVRSVKGAPLGQYEMKVGTGTEKEIDLDGSVLSEAEIKDGFRHGEYKEWFEGNLRVEGSYFAMPESGYSVKDGRWIFRGFKPEGPQALIADITYAKGVPITGSGMVRLQRDPNHKTFSTAQQVVMKFTDGIMSLGDNPIQAFNGLFRMMGGAMTGNLEIRDGRPLNGQFDESTFKDGKVVGGWQRDGGASDYGIEILNQHVKD